jgi:Caspase recruitment domain
MGNLVFRSGDVLTADVRCEPDDGFDEFVGRIEHHRNNLLDMIDIDNGLLDAMVSTGVLTHRQVTFIRDQRTMYDRIDKTLGELISLCITRRHMQMFLAALDRTRHRHVSNFLRGNGNRTADHADEWPLIYCSNIIRKIDMHRSKLIELIDSRCGLLDELLSAGRISIQHKQRIESCVTDAERNELLFMILRRSSLSFYNTLIQCLVQTKQHVVVSLLAPDV